MPHRINLALDGLTTESATKLAKKVGKKCHALKIHDLLDKHGPIVIQLLKDHGVRNIWVDYKLHDIPKTVNLRAKAHFDNGADIITVHASGGVKMMQAAVESGIKVYAVTILTSLPDYEVSEIYGKDSSLKVPELALMAKEAGCNGIVCSPLELPTLKTMESLRGMEFVTPGVRTPGIGTHDQARVDTPANALSNGATALVVGREVVEAVDPISALENLLSQIPRG